MKNLYFFAFLVISAFSTISIFPQWTFVSSPNIFYPTNHIASYNGKLYVANNIGVYESVDGGESWTELTTQFGSASSGSRFLAFSGSYIYVGTTSDGVYMSPDNGSTWQSDTAGLQSSGVLLLQVDGDNIFVSVDWFSYAFYKKSIGASNWVRINSGNIGTTNATRVVGLGRIGSDLFAATFAAGLYKSTNDGDTWTQVSGTGYPPDLGIAGWPTNLLVHGNNLILRSASGVHRSTNLGASWARIDQGFALYCPIPNLCWTPILAFYTDGTNIFAGVQFKDSAYVSTDGGNTWQDLSDGDLQTYLTSFTVHNGVLFATTWLADSNRVMRYGGTTSVPDPGNIPVEFSLLQNYPNPFNPSTKISWQSPGGSHQTLKIYDILGNEVATLVDEYKPAGKYEVEFNAIQLSSGVYFYQLKAGDYIDIKKMILLR